MGETPIPPEIQEAAQKWNNSKKIEKPEPPLEREYTAADKEKFFDAVRDINAYGTAYSGVGRHGEAAAFRINYLSSEEINQLLNDGLLANPSSKWQETAGKTLSEVKGDARKNAKGGSLVYFNIAGRTRENYDAPLRDFTFGKSRIHVIFDMSSRQELPPARIYSQSKEKRKHGAFWAEGSTFNPHTKEWERVFGEALPGTPEVKNHPRFQEMFNKGYVDKNGRPIIKTIEGFVTHMRIPPRFFRGFALDIKKFGPTQLNRLVEQAKLHYSKTGQALPIYNLEGDLLWPQNIKNSEIKKFLDARKRGKQ